MSEVYWGIVGGLAAMVVTLFVCMDLLYSDTKGSSDASSRMTDRSSKAADHSSSQGRHAA
jgi:hypothetical protein